MDIAELIANAEDCVLLNVKEVKTLFEPYFFFFFYMSGLW
jgi:hypothetical protein